MAIERYNAFVTKQRDLLDTNAILLKAHFLREAGAEQGQSAYDQYATALANGQSARATDPGFCATIDTFLRMATDASQPDLLILSQSISKAPASGDCLPTTTAAAPVPQATVVVAQAADAAVVQPPVTQPPVAEAAVAQVAAAETAAEAPAAAQPVAAPAPTVSREEALQAAIVALQSATAALQAANASAAAQPAPAAAQTASVKIVDAPVTPPRAE